MLFSFFTIPVIKMLADDSPDDKYRLRETSVFMLFWGRFIFWDNIWIRLLTYFDSISLTECPYRFKEPFLAPSSIFFFKTSYLN